MSLYRFRQTAAGRALDRAWIAARGAGQQHGSHHCCHCCPSVPQDWR